MNVFFDEAFSQSDYTAAIRADFTRRAGSYDSGASGKMHIDLIERLLETYPAVYPVLDIACGTGLLARALGREGSGVTGVDITEGMLEVARRNAPKGRFIEARAESLPFEDGSFSSVYICSALVYFTDVVGCLKECRRVLGEGGFVAYQAVTKDSYVLGVVLEEALVECFGVVGAERYFKIPHEVSDSEEDNRRLLREAGFEEICVVGDRVCSKISVEGAIKWWEGTMMENAMLKRVGMMEEGELEKVRKRFVEGVEGRRGAEGMIEDRVSSWFVCGVKRR